MKNCVTKTFTTTSTTTDDDAKKINLELNDVDRMIRIGKELILIKDEKFNGCFKRFRRWVRMNLDKDEKSVIRYMTLAENEDLLKPLGIIRLSETYSLLGIDGNIYIEGE